ncbi:MAG: GNAT family N-acetyltransferase [Oligoflexia bacterium]|nr:GNAT family N-acetyltransferase [Oligoflexia bacterium]
MYQTLTKIFNQMDDKPFKDIFEIYRQCHWGEDDVIIRKAIIGSFATIVAYRSNKPVGLARVISDGVAYALLVDTMVVPELKRSGIGTLLVRDLINYCKNKNIFMLKLISSNEGKLFYEKLGFKQCSNEEPGMVLYLQN